LPRNLPVTLKTEVVLEADGTAEASAVTEVALVAEVDSEATEAVFAVGLAEVVLAASAERLASW
jgi:hypothetical protein